VTFLSWRRTQRVSLKYWWLAARCRNFEDQTNYPVYLFICAIRLSKRYWLLVENEHIYLWKCNIFPSFKTDSFKQDLKYVSSQSSLALDVLSSFKPLRTTYLILTRATTVSEKLPWPYGELLTKEHEILTALIMKIIVFWNLTTFSLVHSYWHFGGTSCFSLQGRNPTASFFEKLVTMYGTCHLHLQGFEA
jgi:hypothetical protein